LDFELGFPWVGSGIVFRLRFWTISWLVLGKALFLNFGFYDSLRFRVLEFWLGIFVGSVARLCFSEIWFISKLMT